MANAFLKATVIARMTIGLLYRELVIARTVWTDAISPGEFDGAFGDTVTLRVPARRTAKTRVLRAGTPLVTDDSSEFGVPVQLDTDVYESARISDEELTLDIQDFGAQILKPQITAVAEGVEDLIAAQIVGATYPASHTIDPLDAEFQDSDGTDWYKVLTRARRTLNESSVPVANRFALIGSGVEEDILNHPRFNKFDHIGGEATDALREAAIGRIAGFTTVPSAAIPAGNVYAYHRTGFVLAAKAPVVPRGATMGQSRSLGSEAEQMGAAGSFGGISVRWLMDYDYANTRDRSLVNTWVGTAPVTDPDNPADPASTMSLVRAVKIDGPES